MNALVTTIVLAAMGMPLEAMPLPLVVFYVPVLLLLGVTIAGPRRAWGPIATVLIEAAWLVWTNTIAVVHYIEWADSIAALVVIFLIGVERLRKVHD
ncbi:hypothetical protein [Streptosporangium jomthongense]|uniref:Uncharacterized protein n=1 Tax=Streptosporangium jomthongense TaxID=1193683 RepID=A0ABV8FD66_9ACTN